MNAAVNEHLARQLIDQTEAVMQQMRGKKK